MSEPREVTPTMWVDLAKLWGQSPEWVENYYYGTEDDK